MTPSPHCTNFTNPSELQQQVLQMFLKGMNNVPYTDHSCAWSAKGEGKHDSPLHDFLSVPAKTVVLNSGAVVADVLWQAAVKTAIRLQLR